MVWVSGPDCNKKERECGCCLEIEDSIVVIICGEIEIERLKECLQTALEVKGNENAADQE